MKKKTFDCVQMKWDIQRKQREAFAGMSGDDRRRALNVRIQADPLPGPLVKSAASSAGALGGRAHGTIIESLNHRPFRIKGRLRRVQ